MCKKLMFLISLVSVMVLAGSGLAEDYVWEGDSPYSQLFVDPLNWDPEGGPGGPGDTAELEPGFPGDEPVVLIDNSVGGIKGPRRDEDGDMTLEIVSGFLQLDDRWELVDGSGSGTSIINIGLGIGYGDPCVHMNNGFEAFTDEDAGGELYLNIGGNSYVLCDDDFKAFTDDKPMLGYFEMNIGDTATVDIKEMRFGDDTTLSESQLTVSGSATLNVFDGDLRHSDSDVMSILITDDAYVYVDGTFRGADGDAGSDETHITGNAHVVLNNGWESQDGTTLWTVDGNALVEIFDNESYFRNGSMNVGGTAELLSEKDLQTQDGICVINMYDCGPHVVCEGLGLPGDDDSDFATFNLHGGLIEIGVNGFYHENDDWLLDICGCGVMVIDGDKVDEILADSAAGNITTCGFGPCGGNSFLMVDYNHPDFPGDRTTVSVVTDINMASDPEPPCGEECDGFGEAVPSDQQLSWTPGECGTGCSGEITHFVFLSTNEEKVCSGNLSALVDILPEEQTTYDPGPLELGATYYWAVHEVYDCGTSVSGCWCFTVVDCMIVEDMESYDESCTENAVWEVWKDGAGDCNGIGGNGTGSSVYLATDPVHGGTQSMEYMYEGTGSERECAYSEAVKTFGPPLNLVDNFEKAMVLFFYGDADNDIEEMYVVLSDGTTDAQSNYGIYGDDNPDDVQNEEWQGWYIDVQDQFGSINLANVETFSIGFGIRGRCDGEYPDAPMGTVFFDDITLCTTICVPQFAPDGDLNDDCVVDWEDLEIQIDNWLEDEN